MTSLDIEPVLRVLVTLYVLAITTRVLIDPCILIEPSPGVEPPQHRADEHANP